MQKDLILKPNDIANLSNGHLFIEPITDPEILCWTEGLISISGLPFDELMEKFERAFDVKIDITLTTLPNIKNVSGKNPCERRHRQSPSHFAIYRRFLLQERFGYERSDDILT